MIVTLMRVLVLTFVAGALVPAASGVVSTPVQAAISADEQAVLDVVVSAEAAGDPAAQIAAIMASGLSGPQKALALQWVVEGATEEQVGALATAIVAAAAAAGAAGQPGTVTVLGTGLGQAYKALSGDGRTSAAEQVTAAKESAVAEQGSPGGMSRQTAALFVSAYDSAAAGTPRSEAGSSGEDTVDPGQTDTDTPTPSPT